MSKFINRLESVLNMDIGSYEKNVKKKSIHIN